MTKYKKEICELLAEGASVEKIVELLGCSMATVYRYTDHRPPKYNAEGLRRCYRCNAYYDKSEFNKDKYSKDGLQHVCRTCNAKMSRQRRLLSKWRDKRFIIDENNENKPNEE